MNTDIIPFARYRISFEEIKMVVSTLRAALNSAVLSSLGNDQNLEPQEQQTPEADIADNSISNNNNNN